MSMDSVIILRSMLCDFDCAAMYNGTSLVLTEFIPNFNRLMAVVSDYNFFTRPEHIDEIGEKLLKKYFPAERIGDHTHLNAVKVTYFIILCIYYGFDDSIRIILMCVRISVVYGCDFYSMCFRYGI